MPDVLPDPSRLGIDGFEIVDVLDSRRNLVLRARRSGESTPTLVVKLLKPEFEPILPGRHRAGSAKLIRVLNRSDGWAPVLETGTSGDGLDYIVQPYYRDGSLLDRLGRGGEWRRSLSLVGQAAAVVGQLGTRRLALGCIRPSYLLVDDGTVVVSAFGMATRRFDDGSTQYRAPEQGAGNEATPASDVYTLGVILAELVAGRQRRPDESAHDLMASLPDSVPAGVIDLLDHATSSRVTNRIANAALLHRAITRLPVDVATDTTESPVNTTTGAGPASTGDDHGPRSPAITTPSSRRDEIESGHGAGPPEDGPLGDLLDSGIMRPAIPSHRPAAAGPSAADPRAATELELEALIETLSGLPSKSEGRRPIRDRPDAGATGDDAGSPDDGGCGELGLATGSGRSDGDAGATKPGGPGRRSLPRR